MSGSTLWAHWIGTGIGPIKRETRDPREAYAELAEDREVPYRDGWLA